MDKERLKELYRRHRPVFHFTSKTGWINDPNGLILYGGYYHLFYQHYPYGVTHGDMHWGHARTKDFMEWEELPVALCPDGLGTIFSGCMVYDEKNTSGFGTDDNPPLVAVFTHHLEQGGACIQYQSLAYSLYGGMNFKKYEGNPVLNLQLKDFRDPKVFWYQPTEKWVMLVSAGKEILFFTSGNLRDWMPGKVFPGQGLRPDEIWECPDLVELKEGRGDGNKRKWVLFVSQNTLDYVKTGIRYFVGVFTGEGFMEQDSAGEELYVDFGRDNYAAATYAGTGGRVIQQGWMNCWSYAEKLPEAGFRGSMTFPRELSLRKTSEGYRVIQKPAQEAEEKWKLWQQIVPDNAMVTAEKIPGVFRYTPEGETGKIIFCSRNGRFQITVDFVYGKITVSRSGCGEGFEDSHFQETRWMYFCREAARELYIVVDVTSVEVFAADGEAVGTFQYFVGEPFDRIITGTKCGE